MTVVVIAYNDAARLPAALRSAVRQTLRDIEIVVVDDASTDGTASVAEQFAADDARVRVVRLDLNSGGCSRPRNEGLSVARGRYVMFLDSDDTLPRGAAHALTRTALRTGVDVVSGRTIRRYVRQRRDVGWKEWLYERRAVVDGILDRPELLYDTTCTNKLYRREFLDREGIRFPEGLHYEDLLFTTEVYCTARGIATIPDNVYVWNVVHGSETPSISNRRLLLDNWQHRIEAHRRIDAFLTSHGVGRALRVAKDAKFLDHDFRLLLADVVRYPEPARSELVALVGGYVAELDAQALSSAHVTRRVGAYLAAVGDVGGVRAVAEFLASGQVSSDVVDVDGSVYWTRAHLDSAEVRAALDVTSLGWERAALPSLPLTAVATAVEQAGDTLVVRGYVPDLLGRIGAVRDAVTVRAEVVSRNAGWVLPAAVPDASYTDGRVEFCVEYPMAAVARRLTPRDRVLVLGVVVSAGREERRIGLVTRDVAVEGLSFAVRRRIGRVIGDELAPRTVDGVLGFALQGRHRAIDGAMAGARRVRDARAVRRVRRVARRLRPSVG